MKKISQIIILLLLSSLSFSQTTYFYGTNKVQSKGHTGALYKVEIDRDRGYTFVTIELIPTHNMFRLRYWSSYNTKIKSGDFEAKLLGALSNDGKSTHSCDCSDGWGWSNAKKGKKYYYTLVFGGAIPPGYKNFSLIDEGSYSGCRGFGFRNYTLNNPDNHPKTSWTEYSLKSYWSKNGTDIIEGIYENAIKTKNSPKYKLALKKSDNGYNLIYLSGAINSVWKVGDIKAYLTRTATPNIFKVKWYMGNKTISEDLYITFEKGTMKIIWTNGSPEELYLKLYPTSDDAYASNSAVKGSGTGFALSSKGIIATNYHVVGRRCKNYNRSWNKFRF